MKRRVGLVTSQKLAQLNEDDRLLVEPLAGRGVEAVPVVWSTDAWRAPGLEALVVRSPWDYMHRYAEFSRWLDDVEAAGARLMNPVSIVRWNLDKRYLLELEARGVPIIPTALARQGTRVDLGAVLRERGWEEALIKPTVSANAIGVRRFNANTAAAAQGEFDEWLERMGVLIQPFQPSVVQGELSFVFFDRRFSHAVRKRPAAGDYRVQEDHGGTNGPEPEPSRELLAQAEAVLAAIDGDLTYARVDGVVNGGRFLLMEVELAEPSLYLTHHPPAAATFAEAIAQRL